MPKYLSETVIALRLIWFRVLCYFLIPFCTVLLGQTETWSQDTWDTTGWFIKTRIVVIALIAGLGAFVAFLDQSLQRAKNSTEVKPVKNIDGGTEFVEKQT